MRVAVKCRHVRPSATLSALLIEGQAENGQQSTPVINISFLLMCAKHGPTQQARLCQSLARLLRPCKGNLLRNPRPISLSLRHKVLLDGLAQSHTGQIQRSPI